MCIIRRIVWTYKEALHREQIKAKGKYIKLMIAQMWRRRGRKFKALPFDYSELFTNKARYMFTFMAHGIEPACYYQICSGTVIK